MKQIEKNKEKVSEIFSNALESQGVPYAPNKICQDPKTKTMENGIKSLIRLLASELIKYGRIRKSLNEVSSWKEKVLPGVLVEEEKRKKLLGGFDPSQNNLLGNDNEKDSPPVQESTVFSVRFSVALIVN